MNYIIIEDEQYNAELLHGLVSKIDPSLVLLDIFETVNDSVQWLRENKHPDIIFMDIRLADGISFDIFKQVKVESPVIFTTAYDEYALQAFKVFGAAYLIKPITKEELEEAIEKVKKSKLFSSSEDIDILVNMFKTRTKQYKTRFLLHYRETYRSISTASIEYIELNNKVTYFHLTDGATINTPYSLEELEEQLDPVHFFRVNRQFIIHIDSIAKIHKYFNDRAKITLTKDKDAEIIVSRVKMPSFKEWLDR